MRYVLLTLLLSVVVMTPALAEVQPPEQPTEEPDKEPEAVVMYVLVETPVSEAPERGAPTIGYLQHGDQVHVLERHKDGTDEWYRIRPHRLQGNPDPAWTEGWVMTLWLTTSIIGEQAGAATPTPVPEPEPAGDPDNEAQPAAAPEAVKQHPDASAEAGERIVTAHACLDLNQNRACDVGEGIVDAPVYVLDSTGERLAKARTNDAGIATLVVKAAPDQVLTVNIPYFKSVQQISPYQHLEPVIVAPAAPIPSLLP